MTTVFKDEELFLVTLKDLQPGEEVLYWLDDPYLMWTKSRSEKKSKFLFLLRRTTELSILSVGNESDSWKYDFE